MSRVGVGPRGQFGELSEALRQLDAKASALRFDRLGGPRGHVARRAVVPERRRHPERAGGPVVIIAKVDAMELGVDGDQVLGRVFFVIVGAQGEDRDAIGLRERMGQTKRVVVVMERQRRGEEREQEVRVPVAAGHDHARRLAEGAFDERARVEEPNARLAARDRARRRRLPGDDPADESTVASRCRAREEVDVIDERLGDDRGARPDVKERGDRNAIDEVAGVGRRRSSHVEVGQSARHRRDARKGRDGLEGVSERARHRACIAPAQVLAAEGIGARFLAVDRDLDGSGVGCRGGGSRRRGPGGHGGGSRRGRGRRRVAGRRRARGDRRRGALRERDARPPDGGEREQSQPRACLDRSPSRLRREHARTS